MGFRIFGLSTLSILFPPNVSRQPLVTVGRLAWIVTGLLARAMRKLPHESGAVTSWLDGLVRLFLREAKSFVCLKKDTFRARFHKVNRFGGQAVNKTFATLLS